MATTITITITTDDTGNTTVTPGADADFEVHAVKAVNLVADPCDCDLCTAKHKTQPDLFADEGETVDLSEGDKRQVTLKAHVTTFADEGTIRRTAFDLLTPLAEENGAKIDSILVQGRDVTVEGFVNSSLSTDTLRREVRSLLVDIEDRQPVRIESIEVGA